jgi:DNA-binding transcriptional regulator YdaS (Cro superfamily)
MSHIEPLARAIKICGMKPLASAIGVSYQAVQKYIRTKVPSENVIAIAEVTNWKVTPHELRPDIYPHPQDGLPEHLRSAA